MPELRRAVLSIGGNQGDSAGFLRTVADEFAGQTVARSPFYATPPWGGVEQDDFLNAVLVVDVPESPLDLLRRCQRLEEAADREREVRWGPRTLDVDVVMLYDGTGPDSAPVESRDPDLLLPHPRAGERAFVLVPWLEADPAAELNGTPVADLIGALPTEDVEAIRKLDTEWDGAGRDTTGRDRGA